MSLFINNQVHPDVYKNKETVHEPNQSYTRKDFLTELIMEQRKATVSLEKSYEELRFYHQQQESANANHWNKIGSQLNELKVKNHQHEEIETQMLQWLKTLDEKNINLQSLLENQLLLKNGIMDQVNKLSATTEDIVNRLDQNEVMQQKLSSQLTEKLDFQQASVAQQEQFQANVLKRLDNQEALTEKISRQLNHIRSILFERTNYLATKVEDGYKITSSYIYKLMTGSEQPLTFFLMNHKKEENQKHSD